MGGTAHAQRVSLFSYVREDARSRASWIAACETEGRRKPLGAGGAGGAPPPNEEILRGSGALVGGGGFAPLPPAITRLKSELRAPLRRAGFFLSFNRDDDDDEPEAWITTVRARAPPPRRSASSCLWRARALSIRWRPVAERCFFFFVFFFFFFERPKRPTRAASVSSKRARARSTGLWPAMELKTDGAGAAAAAAGAPSSDEEDEDEDEPLSSSPSEEDSPPEPEEDSSLLDPLSSSSSTISSMLPWRLSPVFARERGDADAKSIELVRRIEERRAASETEDRRGSGARWTGSSHVVVPSRRL